MNIYIVAQYLGDISNFENNNSRFVYIAKKLVDCGNNVKILTSDFSHKTKQPFENIDKLKGIEIITFHEKGYPANICLNRFVSHHELAKNIGKYLKNGENPDVIYTACPSLDVAMVVARHCKKNKIKFFVDIQDLWPEAFKLRFNIPVISRIIFYPFTLQANYVYKQADEIISVSNTYAERGMRVNQKCKKAHTVFLGTSFQEFDLYKEKNKVNKSKDEFWIGYVGTLGASYDITCINHAIKCINDDTEAIRLLHNAGYRKIVFQVMGDGPQKEEFIKDATNCGIEANFTGFLTYPDMVGRLCACDIAVNPINHGAAQSVINKVGDYAAAGLPVINTLENREYRKLVHDYKCGFNCKANNYESVANALKKFLSFNEDKRNLIGRNNRRLGEDKFDRNKSYKEIIELITQANIMEKRNLENRKSM